MIDLKTIDILVILHEKRKIDSSVFNSEYAQDFSSINEPTIKQ